MASTGNADCCLIDSGNFMFRWSNNFYLCPYFKHTFIIGRNKLARIAKFMKSHGFECHFETSSYELEIIHKDITYYIEAEYRGGNSNIQISVPCYIYDTSLLNKLYNEDSDHAPIWPIYYRQDIERYYLCFASKIYDTYEFLDTFVDMSHYFKDFLQLIKQQNSIFMDNLANITNPNIPSEPLPPEEFKEKITEKELTHPEGVNLLNNIGFTIDNQEGNI